MADFYGTIARATTANTPSIASATTALNMHPISGVNVKSVLLWKVTIFRALGSVCVLFICLFDYQELFIS